MTTSANEHTDEGLVLTGLDGSNPLAFLAALGTVLTAKNFCPDIRLRWVEHEGTWRPEVCGVPDDRGEFTDRLSTSLQQLSTEPFQIEKKMPFPAPHFREYAIRSSAEGQDRRFADFLASFGSECATNGDDFQDTLFRMVRSGDSAGQGFLYYALKIREKTDRDVLWRTLFSKWLYQDECFSLRWDPMEDSKYALRWGDPSKADKNTMIGANSLALEAMQLLPTAPTANRLYTTGFHSEQRTDYLTWPIWNVPVSPYVIRSLLALNMLNEMLDVLNKEHSFRHRLKELGVQEVFRSRRYAPNQYYRNFSPARSV